MIVTNRINFADWFNQNAPDGWAAKSVSTSTANFCSIGKVHQEQVKWLWITRQRLIFEPIATYFYFNTIKISADDWSRYGGLLSLLFASFEEHTGQTITVDIES